MSNACGIFVGAIRSLDSKKPGRQPLLSGISLDIILRLYYMED